MCRNSVFGASPSHRAPQRTPTCKAIYIELQNLQALIHKPTTALFGITNQQVTSSRGQEAKSTKAAGRPHSGNSLNTLCKLDTIIKKSLNIYTQESYMWNTKSTPTQHSIQTCNPKVPMASTPKHFNAHKELNSPEAINKLANHETYTVLIFTRIKPCETRNYQHTNQPLPGTNYQCAKITHSTHHRNLITSKPHNHTQLTGIKPNSHRRTIKSTHQGQHNKRSSSSASNKLTTFEIQHKLQSKKHISRTPQNFYKPYQHTRCSLQAPSPTSLHSTYKFRHACLRDNTATPKKRFAKHLNHNPNFGTPTHNNPYPKDRNRSCHARPKKPTVAVKHPVIYVTQTSTKKNHARRKCQLIKLRNQINAYKRKLKITHCNSKKQCMQTHTYPYCKESHKQENQMDSNGTQSNQQTQKSSKHQNCPTSKSTPMRVHPKPCVNTHPTANHNETTNLHPQAKQYKNPKYRKHETNQPPQSHPKVSKIRNPSKSQNRKNTQNTNNSPQLPKPPPHMRYYSKIKAYAKTPQKAQKGHLPQKYHKNHSQQFIRIGQSWSHKQHIIIPWQFKTKIHKPKNPRNALDTSPISRSDSQQQLTNTTLPKGRS
eukprot:gene3570-2521_t